MNEYGEFLGQLAEMRSELVERERARTEQAGLVELLALASAIIVIVLACVFIFCL